MSKTSKTASHVTAAGTRKFLANGPVVWGDTFKKIAEAMGGKGTPEGVGIRAALAFAMRNVDALLAGAPKVMGDAVRAVDLLPEAPAPAKKPEAPAKKAPAKKPAAKKPAAKKPEAA
jgi:hypothetical protein